MSLWFRVSVAIIILLICIIMSIILVIENWDYYIKYYKTAAGVIFALLIYATFLFFTERTIIDSIF